MARGNVRNDFGNVLSVSVRQPPSHAEDRCLATALNSTSSNCRGIRQTHHILLTNKTLLAYIDFMIQILV